MMNKVEKKYSSIHSLNADVGLNIFGKIKWIIFNLINNSFPFYANDKSIVHEYFKINDINSNWSKINKISSPARRLCDLFWMDFPLHVLEAELGGIRAIEVGCGSGTYGSLLNKLLDNRVVYTGVDINYHSEWESFNSELNYKFVIDNSDYIKKHLTNENFIFTQSALEHFSEDLTFFRQIEEYVRNADYPIVQVHLIPSASCISTFTWHGIRQYTPRNISKITELFSDKTEKTIIRLGSTQCNKVHRQWISFPRYLGGCDQREKNLSAYDDELKKAIQNDMDNPDKKEVCFYALIIKSAPTHC